MRIDKYELLQLIFQGKIERKKGFRNPRQWTGMTSVELFRSAINRIRWVKVIANIYEE